MSASERFARITKKVKLLEDLFYEGQDLLKPIFDYTEAHDADPEYAFTHI